MSDSIGAAFDTFGLMTQVMKTHGLRHGLSSKIVLLFGGISYNNNLEEKRNLCLKMLDELRLAGGVEGINFVLQQKS